MERSFDFHDPLSLNLKRQSARLIAEFPNQNDLAAALQYASSRAELLDILSQLLSQPQYTSAVASAFRPILLDLCARWLHDDERRDEKLEALCFLLEIHPELYPLLALFVSRPGYELGPLAFVCTCPVPSLDRIRLHCLLLAYYRLLEANRILSRTLSWPLAPLSKLIWTPHPDPGVRLLAIRCYALHAGMMETERVKMEKEAIGDVSEVDCPISYSVDRDGCRQEVDGWLLPVIEAKRVVDSRNALLDPQEYFGTDEEPIQPSELSPLIANVHGILLLRSSISTSQYSLLVHTPTTVQSLRSLAVQISLRVPTLLTSAPSAGKSLLLSHLVQMLRSNIHTALVTIHLADTSLDARALLGSYVSSPSRPGSFEWADGVLVRAMRAGAWVMLEDVDRASSEVLGVLKPLVESLGADGWIGARAVIDVPGRGRVEAEEGFAIFATRSVVPGRSGSFPAPAFFGAHKFYEVIIPSPTEDDLKMIVDAKFPRLIGAAARGLIAMWEAVRGLGSTSSTREVGIRELEKLCARVESLLPSFHQSMDVDTILAPLSSVFPNPTLREDIYLEARDVFFGSGATTTSARSYVDSCARVVAEHLGLSPERRDWLLNTRTPELEVERDVDRRTVAVRAGRTRLLARTSKSEIAPPVARPFAMHRPAVCLLSRIASAVSLGEPVLLTGETGTGKTSIVTHLAGLLRRRLISLNLSNQTESSDIVGGFKPVDARMPGMELQERFLELFGGTFSRKKNAHFEESVRRAVREGKWKRATGLWLESVRLAKERIRAHGTQDEEKELQTGGETPRKRRKVDMGSLKVSEASWEVFERDVQSFAIQHVQGKSKFAFAFVEGPLVRALRSGDWILLDEVNLASPETLECIAGLLHGPTASIILTEQGSLEPVPRHPDFRLFACMNPATDVGKKDLPPRIRSRFTEIDVPPPDADKDTLLSIVAQYIGSCAVGDRGTIMDVAEFYSAVKQLADARQIADGANHRPHYSMRTLARALTFAADMTSAYSLRRALWEGCLMAFTMVLDGPSAAAVSALAQKHLLAGVRNPRSLLSKDPSPPANPDAFIKLGPFYLQKGPLPEDLVDDYIMTPSVETKVIDLARIISAKRFPVLIEGPTSSGKTSSIEYLAKRTGHRFVRINNHEHTDIQEYLGTYVSDAVTGKLVFKDGLLVRALRNGDWIVLDELNLAPTDVLEALNRLLDDNRELLIPETQEVVRPHPHFMLFATQNPPGLYAGRKVLSRAFRNRFLEVHFEDVPQAELETILCQRCKIAPSYGQKIVSVFRELQKRRQSSRVFESKHGFATLRDLFRWAGRDALGYQELAANGYMLLAERARREDDKAVVKEVIESIMKVNIDEKTLYDLRGSSVDFPSFLHCPIPSSSQVVWTGAMQRLFILVGRALRFNEPVLLVGETGCGKTSVCQLYAEVLSRTLRTVNCHQNTETADLIGGLRPIRNRAVVEAEVLQEATSALERIGVTNVNRNASSLFSSIVEVLKSRSLNSEEVTAWRSLQSRLQRLSAMFEWCDGPLIEAMRNGDVFLLDEISLADDSVLERLNSVLEPERTVVLAERGGDDVQLPSLSPALRNRFTEIWVPSITDRRDLECIVENLWHHEALRVHTGPLLDFVEWLSSVVADRSVLSLRDILAWVAFSNATFRADLSEGISVNEIFHHAAHMTFLDGLGSLPQLSAYSRDAMEKLKLQAEGKLQEVAPLLGSSDYAPESDPSTNVQLGIFSVPRGPKEPAPHTFSLQAPTTCDNVMRVVRACQLPKPILLEGSPGVGKTSLVAALANFCGYELCRINLSDQTDLVDLFGSDLPVEGGDPGQFAWKDAEFLRALQMGHWVLLDEMNLAPQAVLEGLNAVLDHRGTVYIPELGRSFARHPSFRIFAAQNPLHQGGGRKGLPKSFLNRFTKVYVQEMTSDDLLLICRNLFPVYRPEFLRGMITYATYLNEETMIKRTFAREGSPWEFNLRDVLRWATLLQHPGPSDHPSQYLSQIFLQRFRTRVDREQALLLFDKIFSHNGKQESPSFTISSSFLQVGHLVTSRAGHLLDRRCGRLLQAHLPALEAICTCLENAWLTILTGSRDSGKTNLVRLIANLTGRTLREISINHATDATDILGSFEEIDLSYGVTQLAHNIVALLDDIFGSCGGSKLLVAARVLDELGDLPEPWKTRRNALRNASADLIIAHGGTGRLEWVDGPLVRAMSEGHWLLLDGANLCNASVLDRLNSLCETDGVLTLNERGAVNGQVQVLKPHPNFRLFMSVDPHYGELSRAMRNRGVEIALVGIPTSEDSRRLLDHCRLPLASVTPNTDRKSFIWEFELIRRGVSSMPISCISSNSRWSIGSLLSEDCSNSLLADLAPSLPLTPSITPPLHHRAVLYFIAHCLIPVHLPFLSRFVCALDSPQLGSNLGTIGTMLSALRDSRVMASLRLLQDNCGRSCGVPLEILVSQPVHSPLPHTLVPGKCSEVDQLSAQLLPALRLFIASKFDFEAPDHSFEESSKMDSRKPAKHGHLTGKSRLLTDAIQAAARMTLDNMDVAKSGIDILLKLVSFGRCLQKAATSHSFDFSVVQVVLRWILEALCDRSDEFGSIEVHAEALHAAVSLTSGLGLVELWSSISPSNSREGSAGEVVRLEKIAYDLQRSHDPQNSRSQVLELMALWMLPQVGSEDDRRRLTTLSKHVERLLPKDLQDCESPMTSELEPALIVTELHLLQSISGIDSARLSQDCLSTMSYLLSSGCAGFKNSLSRLVPYKHMIWAIDAGQPRIHIIANVHKRWLEDVWMTSPIAGIKGPSVLFLPTQVYSTMMYCDPDLRPLTSRNSYERSLDRRLRLFSTHPVDSTSRFMQTTTFMLQAILMITACFTEVPGDVSAELGIIDARTKPITAVHELILHMLDNVNHSGFREAYGRHLRFPLVNFMELCRAGFASLVDLGYCWIALCRFMLELYVPDAPLDPAIMRQYSWNFWNEERALFSTEMQMHIDFENRTNGQTSNPAIQYLSVLMLDAEKHLGNENMTHPCLQGRDDVTGLHSYWTEVSQFLTHVISPAKIDATISALRSQDAAASMREHVVQESLTSFCQRLSTVYTKYADISEPLQLALLYMKFGLRLVADAVPQTDMLQSSQTGVTAALVAFPAMRSAEMLRIEAECQRSSSSSPIFLVAALEGIALETHAGVDIRTFVPEIEKIYEQVLGLWMIDRTRKEDSDREAQSLYRQNSMEHTAVTEAELEEQDFLSIFPQFEDLLEPDASSDRQAPQRRPLIGQNVPLQLSQVHEHLFAPDFLRVSISNQFMDLRRSFLRTLLDSHFKSTPETLDHISQAFQITLLHDRLNEIRGSRLDAKPYNFYVDANVPESGKALAILQRMSQRLQSLTRDWPDQMVLQHLKDRCDAIMTLDLRSPVAKVLSSLEQLLLQTEDWEMYACRDNTLKSYQQELTTLIVDWRRLELASWQGLLQTQAHDFSDGAAEYWFRLYEATIRGVLAAVEEETRGRSQAVEEYLNGLIPLLDEYIRLSPLGQYKTRLRQLGSFETFINYLSNDHCDIRTATLQRVHRILHFTLEYYGAFVPHISAALARQQSELEKDIRGFIKLASWKDVNVHALKQSAQRSHRQLYKCIRKFRDVLRQPVLAFLQPSSQEVEDISPTQPPVPCLTPESPHFPGVVNASVEPSHLVHLGKTFKKFQSLIMDHFGPGIIRLSPHHVEDLSTDIIVAMKDLSSSSIPVKATSTERRKLEKSLLVRKRKAWSDLLKELKRVGFAANVKPEILERQRDPRWLREQPLLIRQTDGFEAITKGEDYLYRLANLLPDLRATLSSHHQDLSTRELQRGIMLLESGFTMALDARACLADALDRYRQLRNISLRMSVLASARIRSTGSAMLARVSNTKDNLCKLVHALEETLLNLREYEHHQTMPQDVLTGVQSIIDSSRVFSTRISDGLRDMKLMNSPVLVENEAILLEQASAHLAGSIDTLRKWSTELPFSYFFAPLSSWLERFTPWDLTRFPYHPLDSVPDSTNQLINSLLISSQAILSLCPADPAVDSSETEDRFVRDHHRLICSLTRSLQLDTLLNQSEGILVELVQCTEHERAYRIARFLPFLDAYLQFIKVQLSNQSDWTKALFKLDYILCTVVHTVAKQGFCKPPDMEDSGTGEGGTEQVDGTGLGDGVGNENVSKDIEDESQVEGLQGEEKAPEEEVERAEEGNAVEMSEDIGGEMQDIPDKEEGDEEDADQESELDSEEQLGKLDATDPSAVDEKLWGDESGPQDPGQDGKTSEDHSSQKQDSDVVAKEEGNKNPKESQRNDEEAAPEQGDEQGTEDSALEEKVDETEAQDGTALDEYIQEADTLDLPDDMDMDAGQEQRELRDDDSDIEMDDAEQEDEIPPSPEQDSLGDQSQDLEEQLADEIDDTAPAVQEEAPPETKSDETTDATVIQPDIHVGDSNDGGASTDASAAAAAAAAAARDIQPDEGTTSEGQAAGGASHGDDDSEEPSQHEPSTEKMEGIEDATGRGEDASGTARAPQGVSSQTNASQLSSNPLRGLGDALREISRRFEEILDSDDSPEQSTAPQTEPSRTSQMEYMRPEEFSANDELQALGPAQQEEVVKLNDLKFIDDDHTPTEAAAPMEEERSMPEPQGSMLTSALHAEPTSQTLGDDVESALTQTEIRAQLPSQPIDSDQPPMLDAGASPGPGTVSETQYDVELKLRQWEAEGQPSRGAENMWRLYESLTHDLSYALCEQLRLILEPSLATRLKGDYRTGKRLNMKKIIPYIASEFTKDKIWLRRTRPSQREYQVLIALDDSRSMAESHSVHLAYQTLALVSKALGRLEVGDIAIAKFGESVDVLHSFEGGPFTDQAGTKVMNAFHFDQKATQVLSLVETSLKLLEQARERRSMTSASASDLWQLEIIISDGICQDHDRLRTILRKAEEQRVMIVFIILDSLHTKGTSQTGQGTNQNSILSMNQVAYKTVDGRMDLHVERYLDTFPFEYYVVLRDVEALPDVLSGTLKQFFERIAES
ncbi:Midasin [Grifola frondosa]|uniref:Midasin n=1 Tax=Grifola frondosa TaxID=5627 RepID=A0A1C7M161_GRIFR|nr:Midasin [Grifola frondosa]